MLLSVAAASGSFVNVELAWALLQPCISLGLESYPEAEDSGTAAVRHGHLHLLPWLLQHGCPIDRRDALEAAAEHCDLAGMQRVWELLGAPTEGRGHTTLAAAVGRSPVDGVAKLSWLLSTFKAVSKAADRARPNLEGEILAAAAEGAAASGSQPFLQWLLQTHGPILRATLSASLEDHTAAVPRWRGVLSAALRHGHVVVADWLVDEAGCPVLQQTQPTELRQLWDEAAGGGSVESMRWLLRRVGPPVSPGAVCHAARSGRVEAVRFLHQECGLPLLSQWAFCEAAASGSVPLATWLLQAGCPMSKYAYGSAAGEGEGAMLAWLAGEAGCPWGRETLREVMEEWRFSPPVTCVGVGSASSLESVVRAMLEAGCPPGGGTSWEDSIGAAAKLGYLDLVRHLREERGVAFAPGTLAEAARGGCVPVVEWLVGAGCRAGGGSSTDDPYVAAGLREDMATLSCLRRLGVPWNKHVLRRAVQQGPVPLRVVRWMVEHGAPWDEDALYPTIKDREHTGWHEDETVAWFMGRLGMD